MLIYRLHVFADLLPYICTFSDCSDELRQFPSRNAWAEHEWEKHRSYPIWACPECPVECCTSADWIEHVRKVHGRSLASSHGTSAADAAARRRPRIIDDEKCHLCDRALGLSQKDIRSHVGKHLEEVALMALPKENEDDSDGSSVSAHEASDHGSLVGEAPGSASNSSGRCPYQDCGRHVKDLKAHMLSHQAQRPHECPVVSCEYNGRGFARRFDRTRHMLTHYKGTMVCGFCPGPGTAKAKSFNRADVFKRHLTSVHGVEPSSSRRGMQSCPARAENPVEKPSVDSSGDAIGICSTCLEQFASAQEFYEHLDDCVLRVVQREEASEAMTEHHPQEVAKDLAVQETLDRQVPPSAQCDGQDQSSFERTKKTQMNLNQVRNPFAPKQHPPNECSTDMLGLHSRIPDISDLSSSPPSLQPKITRSEPDSRNTELIDANQHPMFQTDSSPVNQSYKLHISIKLPNDRVSVIERPARPGWIQLNDSSSYYNIEREAEACVQRHCSSSLQGQILEFRNGDCTINQDYDSKRVYPLNSVEDWSIICTILGKLSSNGNLRQHLDIHRDYDHLFASYPKAEAQVFTNNDLKEHHLEEVYANRRPPSRQGSYLATRGAPISPIQTYEYASDPRPGVIPTAAWSSHNLTTSSTEMGPLPPYRPVAATSQSEETPKRGFSGRCSSCNRAQTPEWRRGPDGEGTLCNACGLRKISHSRLC